MPRTAEPGFEQGLAEAAFQLLTSFQRTQKRDRQIFLYARTGV